MRSLSARERQLVAVLLLLVAIAAAYFAVVYPIIDGFRSRAEAREQLQHTFLRNTQRIATLDQLQRTALKQQVDLRTMLIVGPDSDEAGETLREQIEATAQAAHVNVKATEAVLSGDEGWVRVALEAQMSHAQLANLLAQLNQQRPAIVIETVVANAADALNDPKSDLLDVRLEVSAPFLRTQ